MTNDSSTSTPATLPLQAAERESDDGTKAFQVLAESVASLHRGTQRPPTGSEVRLEMKRRTYGGFDPKKVGFKRFRDFLDAAEDAGYIEVDRARQGDVSVTVPLVENAPAEQSEILRSDLWKSFVDWNPGIARYYDLEKDRAVMFPKDPAPFEPKSYTDLRERMQKAPGNFVKIEPVTRNQQLAWMKEFAASVPDVDVKKLLEKSLSGERPAKLFTGVLRTSPALLNGWHRTLRDRVYSVILEWRDGNPALSDVEVEKSSAVSVENSPGRKPFTQGAGEPSDRGLIEATSLLVSDRYGLSRSLAEALLTSPPRATGKSQPGGERIREMLHAAIDRMPEEQLRKITIPIGYLFED